MNGHSDMCTDDDGVLDACVCGLDNVPAGEPVDEYDPDDREPMGGDPYWADFER